MCQFFTDLCSSVHLWSSISPKGDVFWVVFRYEVALSKYITSIAGLWFILLRERTIPNYKYLSHRCSQIKFEPKFRRIKYFLEYSKKSQIAKFCDWIKSQPPCDAATAALPKPQFCFFFVIQKKNFIIVLYGCCVHNIKQYLLNIWFTNKCKIIFSNIK